MRGIFIFSLMIIMACSPKTVKEAQKSDVVETDVVESTVDTSRIEIDTEEPDNEVPTEMILEFQKTSCFGKCPVYIIRGYSDGRVIYHGKANVEKVGYYETMLTEDSISVIFEKAQNFGFFELENNYPPSGPPISDLPKTNTYLKKGTIEKKVSDNYDSPLALQQFEKYLDEYFSGLNWVKVNGD